MFDPSIIRLSKEEKGLKPLPYVVWSDAASVPRPDRIKPFDDSVRYDLNDVISNGTRLMVCKRKPEIGYSRDKVEAGENLNSSFDTESKLAMLNGKTYLISAQAVNSETIAAFAGTTTATNSDKLVIQEWDSETGAISPVRVILNASLENLETFEIDGDLYITGGQARDALVKSTRFWKFDGTATSEVYHGILEQADQVLHCRLGTRDFIVTMRRSDDTINIWQWNPSSDEGFSPVTSLSDILLPNEVFVDVNYQIYDGLLYLYVVNYDIGNDTSKVSIYRFDNVRKTMVFVNWLKFKGEITHIKPQEINREFFLHIASDRDFVRTYKLDPQTSKLTFASRVPEVFDYQGIDTDIKGIVLNLSYFYEGDAYYLNIPVLINEGNVTQTLSVTCRWDATLQQYIPFKGITTNTASDWQMLETDRGLFGVITNHRNSQTTPGQTQIIGWDSLTKKFTTTLSEVVGGSIWNLEDWEELQCSTSLVVPFSIHNTYTPDSYVLDSDDKILRPLRFIRSGEIFSAYDWEEIHPKQRIETIHYFPMHNSINTFPASASGVVVPIDY